MNYDLHFQDPSASGTRYLYEEIVGLLADPGIVQVEAIFAFASENGVLGLTADPAFQSLLDRGSHFSVLVGLDAVTDDRALAVLNSAQAAHPSQVSVGVFKSVQRGLFHPKLVRATRQDGGGTLIVGSGNLTPGGLRDNVEAYSVLRFSDLDRPDMAEWDRFLADHKAEISRIDADAFDRGARNRERVALGRRIARGARRRVRRREVPAEEIAAATEEVAEEQPRATDRVLVAAVPRASGRWHQVHFNRPAIELYFRARPNSADRIFLSRVERSVVIPEPPRPVVYSPANVNHKIELGARVGDPYPVNGPPIVVMREVGLRQHIYTMLFPGEDGYPEMTRLLADLPVIGPGAPRVITSLADLQAAWPGVPL